MPLPILKARRLKHCLSIHYPSHVWLADGQFHGTFPDLPGCRATEADTASVYARLDALRRDYITLQVATGQHVPPPRSRQS